MSDRTPGSTGPTNQENQNTAANPGADHPEGLANNFPITLEEALRKGLVNLQDRQGNKVTYEQFMNSDDPSQFIPNPGEFQEPGYSETNAPRMDDLQREYQQDPNKKKRRGLWAALAGAVGVAVIAGGSALALNGDKNEEDKGAAPVGPTPTMPAATSGTLPSPEGPSAPANTAPVDPEESINNEANAGLQKKLAERKPFYEATITSKDFVPLALSDKSRENFAKEYGYRYQKVSDTPTSDLFPSAQVQQEMKTTLGSAERVIAVQKDLQKMFNDGSIEKAIAESNKRQGTNYKLSDFYMLEGEIPTSRTNDNKAEVSAFLANDVIGMGQRYRALATAMMIAEYEKNQGQPGGDVVPDEKPLSTRILEASNVLDSTRLNARAQASIPGTPDSTVPSSANVIHSMYLSDAYPGYTVEANQENMPDTVIPFVGVIATVHERDAVIDPVTGAVNTPKEIYRDATLYNTYTFIPLEVDGKKVAVSAQISSKLLGAVK